MAKRGRPKKDASKAKVKKSGQRRLPGMEDDKIQGIEDAAVDYAQARDKRQAASIKEKGTKDLMMAQMHKAGKTKYVRGEIYAEIMPEGEKLKVRIGGPPAE